MSPLKIELGDFAPPRWARGGHAQTIIAHLIASPVVQEPAETMNVPLPDGDTLVTQVYRGESDSVVVLLHGLGGSHLSGYIQRSIAIARELGHSVIAVNHRGCGPGKGLAKRPYHSGRGEDVSEVIDAARLRFPRKKIIATGFSLGANALLNLLTGQRGTSRPDFAVVVNAPTDLRVANEKLQRGFNRVYDLSFLRACRRDIYEMRDAKLVDFKEKISPWGRLADIDRVFTAPFGGFASPEDYYAQCSTSDHLKKIKTPTVMIMAKDDPFLAWEPYLKAQGNPHIDLHILETGGHMGYLARAKNKLGYRRWLDESLREIFTQAPALV